MLTSFEKELDLYLKVLSSDERKIKRTVSVATGEAAYDFICKMVKRIKKKCKHVECNVYKIVNDYFGHTITVSGLITGVDMINQLKGKTLGEELILPRNMLRAEGDLFLCNTSVDELSSKLDIKVGIAEIDGASFVDAILGLKEV